MCPVILRGRGKKAKLASLAMARYCVGNKVADFVLSANANKQMPSCVILKVTVLENLSGELNLEECVIN